MSQKSSATANYRVIRSIENVNGKTVVMYGIEGCCGEERMILSSLSDDRQRIKTLVDRLNEGEFELCLLKDVVRDFLFESYGVGGL